MGWKSQGQKVRQLQKVVKNDSAKIPWDFQVQTDKMVEENQPDSVMLDKQQ